MTTQRSARRERVRLGRRRWAVASLVGVMVVAGLVAGIVGAARSVADAGERNTVADLATLETTASARVSLEGSGAAEASAAVDSTLAIEPPVEVPGLAGKTLAEARAVLSAAGLSVSIFEDASVTTTAVGDARIVLRQEPDEGELVDARSPISLIVGSTAPAPTAAAPTAPALSGMVVCIDPGHQSRSDLSQEPIGPGATETKERVRGGATGVVTGVPEYEVTLQIAMNLKQRLEAEGVTVVMTRTTNDVNISNAERARVANDAGADLFVRVHCDGSTDEDTNGVSTLYPGANRWTGPIVEPSKHAAGLIQQAVVAETGASSRGTVPRTDLSGFNWSTVPAVVVECGFMSNPVEDKLLTSPHYQDKLAAGITNGILAYLRS